ncbi:MAG: hypothetical protein ACRDY5_10250 [Acidimicrobiales bacterium]
MPTRCWSVRIAILGLAVAAAGCRTGASPVPTSGVAGAAGVAGVAGPGAPPTTGQPGYGAPTVLGRLEDFAISESSGLVASRTNAGLLWTHNDSGDGPFVYCLAPSGTSCGTWRVTGAEARDWEDAAAGPGPDPGAGYLYLGDIGDNAENLDQIIVYRVPEPAVTPGAATSTRDSPLATAPSEALRLRYPDGPHNAEALAVHPVTGDLYIIAKAPTSMPMVYRAPAPLSVDRVTELVPVLGLRLPGFDRGSQEVTGGDIAPDGRRVALSTYTTGYELALPEGSGEDFDAIWRRPAAPVRLSSRRQGDAIAYRLDGQALLTTSEGAGENVVELVRRPATG